MFSVSPLSLSYTIVSISYLYISIREKYNTNMQNRIESILGNILILYEFYYWYKVQKKLFFVYC